MLRKIILVPFILFSMSPLGSLPKITCGVNYKEVRDSKKAETSPLWGSLPPTPYGGTDDGKGLRKDTDMKLQRQLSNGEWVDDERVEEFLDLVLAREPYYAQWAKREPLTTHQEILNYLATGQELSYDTDWYAKIRDGEVHAQKKAIAKQRQAADPNFSNPGWLLDCGHRVHWKAEIIGTSRGSSCPNCYDRMSN